MQKIIIWLCVVGVGYALLAPAGSVSLGPGVKAPDQPIQTAVSSRTPFTHKGSELIPMADYSIRAKVLSRKKYRGAGSEVCPLDLALGWGNMSDEAVLEKIEISQSGRFYYWYAKQLPIPRSEITANSANVHIIPASDSVASILNNVKQGQIVTLGGKLVEVKTPEGWGAVSSLTRTDSGHGACEVMYVETAF